LRKSAEKWSLPYLKRQRDTGHFKSQKSLLRTHRKFSGPLSCSVIWKSKITDFLKSIPAEKILATASLDMHIDTDSCTDRC
jgi:hypothetical protein